MLSSLFLFLRADSRRIPLTDESVHCVVTSPPYWGLRKYDGLGDDHLGLEPTPERYVENMVEIFREVRRVLRADGTCWVNLGDSYAAGKCGRGDHGTDDPTVGLGGNSSGAIHCGVMRQHKAPPGLKPKDLIGIPWRVALALQADGWWLRSDIIWAKPNPMPESVADRPTKAHEYLFLLTKSAKYFYDAEAVREPGRGYGKSERFRDDKYTNNAAFDNSRDWNRKSKGGGISLRDGSGRNRRSVWTIPTAPFPEAHFATFPPALVEPCVKAGTSEKGCCPTCGTPWVRVSDVKYENPGNRKTNGPRSSSRKHEEYGTAGFDQRKERRSTTVGWRPGCECFAMGADAWRSEKFDAWPTSPCVVLDPFSGAGTTVLVAERLGRKGIGIELSEKYCEMSRSRIEKERAEYPLLLGGV